MTSNEGEPTHVCLDCGAKQAEPDNPLGWCLSCFWRKLTPLPEVRSRVFPDDEITKDVNFLLNRRAAGVFLMAEPGMGNSLICTIEDIELLCKTLKQSLTKRSVRIKKRNQSNEIKLILSKGDTVDTGHYGRVLIQQPGYVYLAYSDIDKAYKVGRSITPEKRVKRLKCKLLHKIQADNMGIAELKLHLALSNKAATDLIDTHGYEWFYLDESDVNYIKSIIGYDNGRFTFKGE